MDTYVRMRSKGTHVHMYAERRRTKAFAARSKGLRLVFLYVTAFVSAVCTHSIWVLQHMAKAGTVKNGEEQRRTKTLLQQEAKSCGFCLELTASGCAVCTHSMSVSCMTGARALEEERRA